jgi:hypothetical protein
VDALACLVAATPEPPAEYVKRALFYAVTLFLMPEGTGESPPLIQILADIGTGARAFPNLPDHKRVLLSGLLRSAFEPLSRSVGKLAEQSILRSISFQAPRTALSNAFESLRKYLDSTPGVGSAVRAPRSKGKVLSESIVRTGA